MPQKPTKPRAIHIVGARQNNLKGISLDVPLKKWTVVTGLSGSGKSSFAFETLYAEGQRRYIESLSTYTRQFLEKMPRPDVDVIENIPPSIALEQRNTILNSRSTVATQTEVMDFFRLLFARAGQTLCPTCHVPAELITPRKIQTLAAEWFQGKKGALLASVRSREPQKKSKSKKAEVASLESLLATFAHQGYRRVVILGAPQRSLDDAPNPPEVYEIEDPAVLAKTLISRNLPKLRESLRVVVDRFKYDRLSKELETRLADSVQQALRISPTGIEFLNLDSGELRAIHAGFACPKCMRLFQMPEPNLFSFNSPMGACARCSGFGFTLELDEAKVVPDPSKTLKNGAIDPMSKPSMKDWERDMFRLAERNGISIGMRYRELTPEQKSILWNGASMSPSKAGDAKDFPGIGACFKELERWKYKIHIRVFIRRYQTQVLCTSCHGMRLKPDALCVQLGKLNLPSALDQTITQTVAWFEGLKWKAEQRPLIEDIQRQLSQRLHFLEEVGVGYLQLSRLAKTLSGGEFQRIGLATQLGSGLCGTLYVLDEPSIGLHPNDTSRIIHLLERLRDQGNTVVVVEHDMDVIRAADHLVELGPGAGARGGMLISQGPAQEILAHSNTATAKFARHETTLERPVREREDPKKFIRITGCRENNLRNLDVSVPLERMVVFTGLSGSGKSTLLTTTLVPALERRVEGAFKNLYGAEQIQQVVLLDQKPIGRSSRSNPATYLKAWEEFRRLYAMQSLSQKRGYTPQTFSFNVEGGRCPTCGGEGQITLDMHFMAEVTVPCDTCNGKRFKNAVLEVFVRGKNLDQLLHTTIDEAYDLYRDQPVLARKLNILRDVGLGYLQLGQSGSSLSGGESQRLKIAAALDPSLSRQGPTLYVLDEPTTGLHVEDIRKLMLVLHDLVEAKNSVWLIEHHLDVIAQSDWIVDLGPGAGPDGGLIVAQGAPRDVARAGTLTGAALLTIPSLAQADREF